MEPINDLKRLIQCIRCKKDPAICGCTDKDEDGNGMCIRYERKEE